MARFKVFEVFLHGKPWQTSVEGHGDPATGLLLGEIEPTVMGEVVFAYSSVYSLPVRSEDALQDEALRTECERVLEDAMDHERRRIATLGGSLELGVIYWDEESVHIHILALDRSRGRVDHLHPGRKAKAAFHKANQDDADRAGGRRAGNKAYCEALRGWQNDIIEAVSEKAGLLRYGPKRFRLMRENYETAKAIAETEGT